MGVYTIDKTGNLIGTEVIEGGVLFVEPTAIEEGTHYSKLIQATDTTGAKVQTIFEYASFVNDADLIMISKAEMDGHNLLKDSGILDLNLVTSLPVVASVTVAVTFDYGTAKTPIPASGLELADFSAAEIAPVAAAEPLASAVEIDSTGVYLLTYTTPVAIADEHRVTVNKTGFAITTSASYITA